MFDSVKKTPGTDYGLIKKPKFEKKKHTLKLCNK